MKLRLVHASRANRFMRDILEGIADEARALGVDTDVTDSEFSEDGDTAHVVIPHEYFATTEPQLWPGSDVLGRTIALGVEHPGTEHFEISATQSERCGAIIDINHDSILELRRRGTTAHHFQIGYTAGWDHWENSGDARDIDLAYLGASDPRRDRALAEFAPFFWDKNCRIITPTPSLEIAHQRHFVTGGEKFDFLARSRVIINMHRDTSRALEWVRIIEAMSNGCVVVSEHAVDYEPLIPGTHFVSGAISTLGLLAVGLLDDPDRLERMRLDAYDFVRNELPMRASVEMLLGVAEDLVRTPRRGRSVTVPQPYQYVPPPPAWPTRTTELDYLGAAIRRIETQLAAQDRAITRMALGLSHDENADVDVYRTPAFDVVEPIISVTITCHNYANEVLEALDSIVATGDLGCEVLIYDDNSQDKSVAAIQSYLEEHPHLPARLISGRVNKGPSAARNDLLRWARSDYVFILDADNGIYPTALDRLAKALDENPDAAFAYSSIAIVRDGVPEQLFSAQAWEPEKLRGGNYIDTMAMVRRDAVLDIGGYDPLMTGWEDFHLWARIAENGMRGVHVPEILGWYRASQHSLSMGPEADHVSLWSRIRRAAPTIMHD